METEISGELVATILFAAQLYMILLNYCITIPWSWHEGVFYIKTAKDWELKKNLRSITNNIFTHQHNRSISVDNVSPSEFEQIALVTDL